MINPFEFEGIRNQACLMENINAVLINDGMPLERMTLFG